MAAQLAGNRAALERLQQIAAQAQTAFEAHNLALATYADAQNALITKQMETITIEKTLMQTRIAMNALLGGELPANYQRYQRQLSEENHHAN